MRKAVGIALISITSPALAIGLGLVMLVVRGIRHLARPRSAWSKIPVSRAEREAFEGRLQEYEFKAANLGPSIVIPPRADG